MYDTALIPVDKYWHVRVIPTLDLVNVFRSFTVLWGGGGQNLFAGRSLETSGLRNRVETNSVATFRSVTAGSRRDGSFFATETDSKKRVRSCFASCKYRILAHDARRIRIRERSLWFITTLRVSTFFSPPAAFYFNDSASRDSTTRLRVSLRRTRNRS